MLSGKATTHLFLITRWPGGIDWIKDYKWLDLLFIKIQIWEAYI